MNTEITNAVKAAKDKAKYDTRVKRVLAQKKYFGSYPDKNGGRV